MSPTQLPGSLAGSPADVDAIVIGAGPGGSAFALAARRLGLRVRLLERETGPRYRLGETLPPKIHGLLGFLGLADRVEQAGFVRMFGSANRLHGRLEIAAFDAAGEVHGYQVERARFDELLLRAAEEAGCLVDRGRAVHGLRREGARVAGVSLIDGSELAAPIVVDASGSVAVVARALGFRRRDSIRTVGVTGYWRGTSPMLEFPDAHTLLESLPDGWIWSLPLADGTRNVTVGLDADAESAFDRDVDPDSDFDGGTKPPFRGGSRRRELELRYHALVGASRSLRTCLQPASLEGMLRATDATLAFADHYSGAGFLLVGDAGFNVDPLTSQGVVKAMQSGILAAAVVNTVLRRPEDAAMALDYYDETEAASRRRFLGHTLRLYRGTPYHERPFWQRRARLDLEISVFDVAAAEVRRVDFQDSLREAAAERIRVVLRPEVILAPCAQLEGGFVVAGHALVREGERYTYPIELETLAPLLGGSTLAEIFETYALRAGAERTPELGQRLNFAITRMVEEDLLSWTRR